MEEKQYRLTWRDCEVFSGAGTMEWCRKMRETFGGDIEPAKPYVPPTQEELNDPNVTVVTKRRHGRCVGGGNGDELEILPLCSYDPDLLNAVVDEIQSTLNRR